MNISSDDMHLKTRVNLRFLVISTLLILLLSLLPVEGITDDNSNYSWPTFQGDYQRTGLATHPTNILNEDHVKWSKNFTGQMLSSPVIGYNGTIYVGATGERTLYAFDTDGSLQWQVQLNDKIKSTPTIDSGGNIYIGTDDGSLNIIDEGGKIKASLLFDHPIASNPIITTNGTLYLNARSLVALDRFNNELWNISTNSSSDSSPALGPDGTIYIGSEKSLLYAINPNGTIKWTFSTSGEIHSTPSVDEDGVIYFGSNDAYLYAVYPNGSLKWKYCSDAYISTSVAIGPSGNIYLSSGHNILHAISQDGILLWNFDTGVEIISSKNGDNEIHKVGISSPILDSNEVVFVGSTSDNLYGISRTGDLLWTFSSTSDITASPAIGQDGTIYLVGGDKNGYLVSLATNSDGDDTTHPEANLLLIIIIIGVLLFSFVIIILNFKRS